jgi:anionic cell wall polymer biosynthesis LytR-Cps2A-Psr (LCP) family protein
MTDSATLAAALDRERRAERQVRFLETVAKSSPQPDVIWNIAEVRQAVNELIETGVPARSTQVISRIMQQTTDAETRELCARALAGVGLAAGQ